MAIEKRGFLAPVIIDRSLDRLFSDLSARQKEDEFELRQELKQVNKTMAEAAGWLGRVLTAYKDTLPHKKWQPFLELIGITRRSAQRYVELASIKKDLGPSMTQALEDKGMFLEGRLEVFFDMIGLRQSAPIRGATSENVRTSVACVHLAAGAASKVGQTAKARSGYRVQSLRKGRDRQYSLTASATGGARTPNDALSRA